MAVLGAVWLTGILFVAALAAEPHVLLEELLRYEAELLEQSARTSTPSPAFGSDPYSILRVPQTHEKLILLRNRAVVLLLDSSLEVTDRKPTPRSPRGWVLVNGRYLFLTGELSNRIVLYRLEQGKLDREFDMRVEGSAGLRDLTYVPSLESLFLIDAPRRRLIQLILSPQWRDGNPTFRKKEYPIGAGALRIKYAHGYLFLNLLLDHRIDVIPLTREGPDFSNKQNITHNGPIWGLDTARRGDNLLIAAVGVEDRLLDRTRGEFGYVDSFLFLYDMPLRGSKSLSPPGSGSPRRFASWNLSAQNIVTPKAVRFEHGTNGLEVWVLAFGSDRGAIFQLENFDLLLRKTFQAPPGSTDFIVEQVNATNQLSVTTTLLDQVYQLTPDDPASTIRVLGKPSIHNRYPSNEARLGELLFFTTLFSPKNRTEGQLSRFTCETCHFEGTIDGRIHYTGRGRVFATTKTLRGLANNVPLFSRAGDRSLASMVMAEFHVANQKRQDDFSLEVAQYPWLKEVKDLPPRLGPLELRKSFLSFFVHFEHRPNPWLAANTKLTSLAVKGLGIFRARCEYCHLATPSTRSEETVAFQEWRASIEDASTDLVWGAPFYTKTNILPYVSTKGARVPSLRRVSEKYPYFTNGSSRHLRDVLERFRYRGATAWHHYDGPNAVDIESLSQEEIDQLEELLRYF